MSTLASISVLTFYGIPVNTLTEAGAVYLQLGHETIYNNLMVFTQIILEPFYRAIDERLRQCHSSNMDETPVSVTLNMIQDDDEKNKDKKNTGKKKGKKKKSYVLAHGADEVATLGIRLVIYKAMSGRSREDIRRCLKGYTITDLTVDGYGGYSSKFLEEITGNEKVQIQRCMDHLKRKGLIDMSASTSAYFGGSFQDSLDKLTDGISIEQPDDKMDELTLMHIVMCCYSRISDYESSFRYNHPCPKTAEEQKGYYELLLIYRQLNETPLVKFIEDAMTYLYETHGATRYDEKNRKFVNVPGKFNTRAVTNFMNSKAEFRTFLTRPEISPSNNLILYRQNRYADKSYSKPCKFSSSINIHRHNILAKDCTLASTTDRSPNRIGSVNFAATIKCKGPGTMGLLVSASVIYILHVLDAGRRTKYYADIFITQWRNYQHLRVLCRHNDFVGIRSVMPISA